MSKNTNSKKRLEKSVSSIEKYFFDPNNDLICDHNKNFMESDENNENKLSQGNSDKNNSNSNGNSKDSEKKLEQSYKNLQENLEAGKPVESRPNQNSKSSSFNSRSKSDVQYNGNMLIDLIISSIQKDEKFNNFDFKQNENFLGKKQNHYSDSVSNTKVEEKKPKNTRTLKKSRKNEEEKEKNTKSNENPSNRESFNTKHQENKLNNSFEILKHLNSLFNNNNGKEVNYPQNQNNDNNNFNKPISNYEQQIINPPFENPNETGGNTLIKRFLFNKMNEVLVNNTLSEKLILYTIISNSNFDNLFPSSSESRKNSPQQRSDSDSGNNQLNNDKNTKSGGNNSSFKNSTKCSQHSHMDFLVRYTNDESVRNIVENFCKYIFANGYSIIHKNQLNLVNNPNLNINNSNSNTNTNNNNQFKYNVNCTPTVNLNQSKEKDYFAPINMEDMRNPQNGNINFNYTPFGNSSFSNYQENDDETQKKRKDIVNCPHVNKKHYAKNMCNNCYHKQGREKKAWNCEHTNRTHYAKGKCQNCYLNFYHKEQVSKKKKKNDEESEKNNASATVTVNDNRP